MYELNESDLKRFWAKVEKTDTCWIWTGAKRGGYGMFRFKTGSPVGAHRISYQLATGKYPKEFVLHSCDNPACVNPEHLFVGTHQDNMDDMYAKNRRQRRMRTVKPPRKIAFKKLSREDVQQIRELLARGSTGISIARRFGVTHQMIYAIKHGKTYASVS